MRRENIRVLDRQHSLIQICGATKTGNRQGIGQSKQVKQSLQGGIVRIEKFTGKPVLCGELKIQIRIELVFPEFR